MTHRQHRPGHIPPALCSGGRLFFYTGPFTRVPDHGLRMQKRPTKREIREQLDREVRDYLDHGGEVEQVQRGASGLVDGRYNDRSLGFEKPREQRTPLTDVLKTIDQRRDAKRQPVRRTDMKKERGPRQKIIYDDFGEPLRVVWEDDHQG